MQIKLGRLCYNCMKFIFLCLGFFFLYHTFIATIDYHYAQASLFFSCSFLSLVFAFLDKFRMVKTLGFEIKLWNSKRKEAEELIDKLKSLSLQLAESSYLSLGGVGRFAGSLPIRSVFNNLNKITNTLKEIGLSSQEIYKVRIPFDRLIIRDIALPIRKQIESDFKRKAEALKIVNDRGQRVFSPESNARIVDDWTTINEVFNEISTTNEDLLIRIEKCCCESEFFGVQYYENLKKERFSDFRNLEQYIKDRTFHDEDHFFSRSNKGYV